jgi:hypothetical protein
LLSCAAFAFGQSKNGGDETAYNDLVAKVKGGDLSVDFKALRIAFTKTKSYSPYGGDAEGTKAAFAAIKAVDGMLKEPMWIWTLTLLPRSPIAVWATTRNPSFTKRSISDW